MTLSNAIAIIRRQDAQVKVEVPATANRKAYSYMRETSGNNDGPLPYDWHKTYTKRRFEKETGEQVKDNKQWEALKAENERITKYGKSKKRKAAAIAIPLALSSALVAYGFSKDNNKEKELKNKKDGDRTDAQVKVEVPATANRKAYSYMREASASLRTPKPSNRKVIGGAIAGAVGVGALTAGVLAMRKAKQNSDEPSQSGDTVTGSSTKGAIAQGQDPQRKKPLVTPPPSGSDRVLITPEPEPTGEPNRTLTFNKGEIDPSQKPNTGKKAKRLLENLELAIKKGVERDRKAGGAFADREIDLNKAAYSAGEKTRIAAQNLATFAKAYGETFGKQQPKAVDVKATEVKEELPEGKPMKKEPKAKEPKPKKAKTPKVPKLKSPTAAEKRAVQQKLNDLNK